jgi:hypothetical protein
MTVRRIASVIAGVFAVLALSIIATAGSASANWFVSGTEVKAGETVKLASTARVDESTGFEFPSLRVRLTCTGGSAKELKAEAAYIVGGETGFAESLVFEGCSEIEPTNCTIATRIPTEPVKIEAAGDPFTLAPKTGKALAAIEFKGPCSLQGEKPLNGQVTFDAPNLAEEGVSEQPLEGLGEPFNNSLELTFSRAYIEGGRMLLKLADGAPLANRAQFGITGINLSGKGSSGIVTITNLSGGNATVKNIALNLSSVAQFTFSEPELLKCERAYNDTTTKTCPWKVEYSGTKGAGIKVFVEDENGKFVDGLVTGKP